MAYHLANGHGPLVEIQYRKPLWQIFLNNVWILAVNTDETIKVVFVNCILLVLYSVASWHLCTEVNTGLRDNIQHI